MEYENPLKSPVTPHVWWPQLTLPVFSLQLLPMPPLPVPQMDSASSPHFQSPLPGHFEPRFLGLILTWPSCDNLDVLCPGHF